MTISNRDDIIDSREVIEAIGDAEAVLEGYFSDVADFSTLTDADMSDDETAEAFEDYTVLTALAAEGEADPP